MSSHLLYHWKGRLMIIDNWKELERGVIINVDNVFYYEYLGVISRGALGDMIIGRDLNYLPNDLCQIDDSLQWETK